MTPKPALARTAIAPDAATPELPAAAADTAALENLLDALARARTKIAKAVVGHRDVIDQLLIALLCEGHVLLEGAPGVGKTLLVRTLGGRHRLELRAHPVHPGPDAGGHHRRARAHPGR